MSHSASFTGQLNGLGVDNTRESSKLANKDRMIEVVVQDESLETVVLSINRVVRGRSHNEYKIVVRDGPRYYIEPSYDSNAFFLGRTKNNKLVGLLKNGKLDGSKERAEKLHYFSKLGLKPNNSCISVSSDSDDNQFEDCHSPSSFDGEE